MIGPAQYRKALVALAGGLAYVANLGVLHGTAQVIVGAVLAALTAAGVYGVRNADPAAEPGDQGAIDLGLIVSIIVGVVLALLLYHCFIINH